MDNRKLSPSALSILRQKAVASVVHHGLTQAKACKIFGFSPTSMCKYVAEYKENKNQSFKYKQRGVKSGARSKITKLQ